MQGEEVARLGVALDAAIGGDESLFESRCDALIEVPVLCYVLVAARGQGHLGHELRVVGPVGRGEEMFGGMIPFR